MRLNVVDEPGEGEAAGLPVVLLHGLTATHRYVVMGSNHLNRQGHRTVAYDARGHGASEAAEDPEGYAYAQLAADAVDVLDGAGLERAVLAGASMGAHTAVRVALDHPGRVAGLVLVTPALIPEEVGDEASLRRWDALSDGLRRGGVEGFVEAYGTPQVREDLHDTVLRVIRQRLEAHEHPEALADALRAVPRSRAFEALEDLGRVTVPTVVVGSRDDSDPGHPLDVAERWADQLPAARLEVEQQGRSPLAWQGGQLSRVIAGLAADAEGS